MNALKDSLKTSGNKISRRSLLKAGLTTLVLSMFPLPSFGYLQEKMPVEKRLSFYNIHTGEYLNTVYWSHGEYITESLNKIDYILRDFRTNEIRQINVHLLDLLYNIHAELNTKESLHVISGYRSIKTNNMLRRHSKGVLKNSLHIYGKAVDIRVPKRSLAEVRKAAIKQRAGGVGYYASSNFVHVDIGTIHYWVG
jgi:uncharacterized protein YcbK (DUF882 family)